MFGRGDARFAPLISREVDLIRDLATDPKKRKLFARLAEHFKVLAGEIEKTTAVQKRER